MQVHAFLNLYILCKHILRCNDVFMNFPESAVPAGASSKNCPEGDVADRFMLHFREDDPKGIPGNMSNHLIL